MCHSTDYDHLVPDPAEDFGLMEPGEIAEHTAWRETLRAAFAPSLLAEWTRARSLAGLPLEADALTFALSLR